MTCPTNTIPKRLDTSAPAKQEAEQTEGKTVSTALLVSIHSPFQGNGVGAVSSESFSEVRLQMDLALRDFYDAIDRQRRVTESLDRTAEMIRLAANSCGPE